MKFSKIQDGFELHPQNETLIKFAQGCISTFILENKNRNKYPKLLGCREHYFIKLPNNVNVRVCMGIYRSCVTVRNMEKELTTYFD